MSLFRIYVDGALFYHPQMSKLAITAAWIEEDAENIDSMTLSAPYNHPYLSAIRPLFFKIFHKIIGTMFNGDAGFKFEEIEADSRHYRVDVLQCPYMKYCELLGCEELTSTFCLSDDRVYGNMCGITFERHGTIGRGSDKCDFYFYMD